MVKRTCFFFLKPVYIGKASNIQRRHSPHERWEEAVKKGASERHYLCISSEGKRARIEEDLIRKYKPKLNRMLKPSSSEDAPNDERLARNWMSAKQYWGLGAYKDQVRAGKKRKRLDNRKDPHRKAA